MDGLTLYNLMSRFSQTKPPVFSGRWRSSVLNHWEYYRWFRHTRGNRSHAITPTCSALHKQIFDHNIMYNGTSSQTFAPLSGYFMGSTDSFQRQILETRSHRFGTQKCIWFLVDKKINRDEILQSPLILVEMIVDSISPKLGSNKSLNHTKFSSV